MNRRQFLSTVALSTFVAGAGCTIQEQTGANIQFGNLTDQLLHFEIEVATHDTLFSDSEIVYDEEFDLETTEDDPPVYEDVLPRGKYSVDVRVSGFSDREPYDRPTFTWRNCPDQLLVVLAQSPSDVETKQTIC